MPKIVQRHIFFDDKKETLSIKLSQLQVEGYFINQVIQVKEATESKSWNEYYIIYQLPEDLENMYKQMFDVCLKEMKKAQG